MMHSIDVENLSFQYPDGRQALENISFCVSPGEKVALIGANGSGKTTLLLHLNGILRSSNGSVTIDGLPLTDKNLNRIRAMVGFVFQNPDDQLFSTTVYEDVAFGPVNMGLRENDVQQRVQNALAAVGMQGYEQRINYHLSLGEKKRIAIATVLSMNPEILVLDEPSSGLDPRARRSLIDLLKSFHQQTIFISTHDMRLAYALSSRVIVLDAACKVAEGETMFILRDEALMLKHGLEPVNVKD
ncbi:MAG TPA: ABC transporter ATP-binding protein [Aggregatilineales bacterium]|nr:ABC transporter ATP-binding protein [Aggregatilineales bacterium]